jgi:hypothetical protein
MLDQLKELKANSTNARGLLDKLHELAAIFHLLPPSYCLTVCTILANIKPNYLTIPPSELAFFDLHDWTKWCKNLISIRSLLMSMLYKQILQSSAEVEGTTNPRILIWLAANRATGARTAKLRVVESIDSICPTGRISSKPAADLATWSLSPWQWCWKQQIKE